MASNVKHIPYSGDVEPLDQRPLLIDGPNDFASITKAVVDPVLGRTPPMWWVAFGASFSVLLILLGAIGWLFFEGVGVWGLNNPVAWGWAIVNFVFWVGIGHAGTLISAILYLFRQKWRTSINRAAEAMTIFAVVCALMFPTIHVGRVWLLYWVFPVPNQMEAWPHFRSPLLWDVFAVTIYGSVSIIFWYIGLIPDLATIRDKATSATKKKIYGFFALGWRGSHRHWQHYEIAYLLLAGLATPLVLSVHSVVSFDFATSQLPGWHTTIFPPYFVAGAIFSGFAMVITLMLFARVAFKMEHIITIAHFDVMAKVILLTGSLVGYAYATEFFIAWYSGNPYEQFAFINRAFGDYAWAYWTMISCNVISPQIFWFKKFRRNIKVLFVVSIFVNIGMWFERFVITVISLHADFLPSSWDYFSPTIWDVLTFFGSFGLFMTLFLLFLRFLPMVAIAEVKTVLPWADPHSDPKDAPLPPWLEKSVVDHSEETGPDTDPEANPEPEPSDESSDVAPYPPPPPPPPEEVVAEAEAKVDAEVEADPDAEAPDEESAAEEPAAEETPAEEPAGDEPEKLTEENLEDFGGDE